VLRVCFRGYSLIDEARYGRYIDKISIAIKRLDLIDEWIEEKPIHDLIQDEKTKLAIYKAFQEVVEALMDIVAMICKDLHMGPKDDYTNIGVLVTEGIIEPDHARILREANGLRNKLIHWYNKINDEIALRSIRRLRASLREILEVIIEWLRRQLRR